MCLRVCARLQAGKFDVPDRLFASLEHTWQSCLTSLSSFKELTPEFFYLPEFLENLNGYDLGERQDGVCLHASRLMYVRMQVCNRLYKILFV